MLEGLWLLLTSPELLFWLVIGVPIGLLFGIIPGLGGKIAIIAIMPFAFSMDPATGAVFLISVHAVVHTGGAIPAIIFGVPGTGPSTAIVADGYALAKSGEGTRAISASVAASVIGGVFGALVLAVLIPISLILVRNLSYPEIFFLALFGISLTALLSGNAIIKGLLTGCFGLLVAFVGHDHVFGVGRYVFDFDFLWDGIGLVVAVLAVYAIPEMLSLSSSGSETRIIRTPQQATGQIVQGITDVVSRMGLTLRCSGIGAVIGLIPGLGGDIASWVCYGHALQSSKSPERFGSGDIDGVIGPEAANNSKEGGALVPTLFLGLPGSSGMAILLVALVPLGINPGPGLVETNPEIPWLMVWALALSNILAGAMVLCGVRIPMKGTANMKQGLVPYVILFALVSVYLSSHAWQFLIVFALFSAIGVLLKILDWPRAPFVIGIVLGPVSEDALVKALGIWGPEFIFRPVSLALLAIIMISLVFMSRQLRRRSALLRDKASD